MIMLNWVLRLGSMAYLPSLHHGTHQAIICHHLVQAHVVVEEVGLPRLDNHLNPAVHSFWLHHERKSNMKPVEHWKWA